MTDKRTAFLENCDAVSEVIGEVLMTAVAVLAFSVLAVFIFSSATPQEKVHADIQGWVGVDCDTIYLRHAGGEPIGVPQLKVLLDINGTRREITPQQLQQIKGNDLWVLGETILINTSGLWSYDIVRHDHVAVTLVSTGPNLVIKSGTLLGNSRYAASPPNTSTATSPVLSDQDPASPFQSNTSEPVTFSASSSQSSINEFLLNGRHIAWSNGSSPSYTNTSATAGIYNLTLVATNSADPLLADSTGWAWTVVENGTAKQSGSGTDMYLFKANKGGHIPDGNYIRFWTGTGGNSITINGVTTVIGNNRNIELVMHGQQTSGTASMDYSASSWQITAYDFNVSFYLDGSLAGTGQVSSIYISKAKDFDSRLSYFLPSYLSRTYFSKDGNSTVLIDQGIPDPSEIRLCNMTPTATTGFELDFGPSSTSIDGFDAQYEII